LQQHPELMGALGERADLGRRVDRAELGRLPNRDHPRLDVVLVAADALPAPEVLRRELAVIGLDGEELHARDTLGSAAFVDVQVGRSRRR